MPIWSHDDALRSEKVRMLDAYWRARQDGGIAPRRALFQAEDLRALLPNIVIVDIDPVTLVIRYRLVGTAIVAVAQFDFTGHLLSDLETQVAEPSIWRESYRRVIETAAPIYGRTSVPPAPDSQTAEAIEEEFGIFPLSHDGTRISQCIAVEHFYYDPHQIAPNDLRPMRPRPQADPWKDATD